MYVTLIFGGSCNKKKTAILQGLQHDCNIPLPFPGKNIYLALHLDQGDPYTFLAWVGMEACTIPAAHHLPDGSRK